MGIIALVLLLVAGARVADAQSGSAGSRVDRLFAQWDRPSSPGCGIAVVMNGRVAYQRGYGMANLDYRIPISPATVFYIASASKQFMATSILLAAEKGLLGLDDDVRRFAPELPAYDRPITPRQMLWHTSGLRDYATLVELSGQIADLTTEHELIRLIADQKALNFPPGEEWSYSNSGYFLLSVILKRASGQSLRVFADQKIFQPLGMRHSHFHDDEVHGEIIPNRAVSYEPASGGGYQLTYLNNFDKVGDGGLYTTVGDLVRWDRNFDDPIVGGATLQAQLRTAGQLTNGRQLRTVDGDTLGYGYGLRLNKYRGLRTVAHTGSFMGFQTAFLRFPEARFSVICLCNLGNIDAQRLTEQIADIYLAARFPPNEPAPSRAPRAAPAPVVANRPFTPRRLEDYTGTFESAELSTVYRLFVEGSDLIVRRHAALDARLAPVAIDSFRMQAVWDEVLLSFTRDPSGAVSGFKADAGRVRGIEFVRREASQRSSERRP